MRRFIINLKGWMGYLTDLFRLMTFDSRNPHNYTKFQMIRSVKRKSNSKIFIEAGTYHGVTADRCARIFDRVYTVELNRDLARKSADFLSIRKNVTVIEGDALKVLPGLLKRAEIQNVLIYLDGHVCGPNTSAGDFPEPAVEELKALSCHEAKINAVIIDDFRNFGVEKNFPEKSALMKAAEENFPNDRFDISVRLDQLIILRK